MALSAEELVAGSGLTHEVEIPPELMSGRPGGSPNGSDRIVLRPLTVRDLQRISKAARDDDELAATFMIQAGLVEPTLGLDEISLLPAGLAKFIVEKLNLVSGIDIPADELEEVVQAPLARACVVLAKEFGWSPAEISAMTIGQILVYLESAPSRGPGAT